MASSLAMVCLSTFSLALVRAGSVAYAACATTLEEFSHPGIGALDGTRGAGKSVRGPA